jgi:hypothetical protein
MGETSVPVPSEKPKAGKEKEEGPDEVTKADEELKPWTGSARAYDRKKEEKPETPKAEKAEKEEELEPWTGSARAYEPKKGGGGKKEEAIPEVEPTEAADLGMDQALVADVSEQDDGEGFREGLEDLPEIKPMGGGKPPAEAKPVAEAAPKKKKKKLKKKKKKPAAEPSPEPVAEAAPKSKGSSRKSLSGKKKAKPAADDGEYSVFLSKIVSSDRRRKAVELLTDIKGISEGEAEKLTNKMIIPVVKGVSKDEAEDILDRFKKSKISGRITRKK